MSKVQPSPSFAGARAGPRLCQRLQLRLQRLHHRRGHEQFVSSWPDGIWSLAKVASTENRGRAAISNQQVGGGLFTSQRAFEKVSGFQKRFASSID